MHCLRWSCGAGGQRRAAASSGEQRRAAASSALAEERAPPAPTTALALSPALLGGVCEREISGQSSRSSDCVEQEGEQRVDQCASATPTTLAPASAASSVCRHERPCPIESRRHGARGAVAGGRRSARTAPAHGGPALRRQHRRARIRWLVAPFLGQCASTVLPIPSTGAPARGARAAAPCADPLVRGVVGWILGRRGESGGRRGRQPPLFFFTAASPPPPPPQRPLCPFALATATTCIALKKVKRRRVRWRER